MDASVLDRLSPGDHVCRVYGEEGQRAETVAGFVRGGVKRGHKVVYFAVRSPGAVLEELASRGVDGRVLCDRGQFEVARAGDGYLTSDGFDVGTAIAGWEREIARAREGGYTGLWAMGDMAWAAGDGAVAERLLRYEREATRFFSRDDALALCLYDRRIFPEEELDAIAAVHPSTLEPADDADWAPLLRMRRTSRPLGLRLIGEADASNRHALAATLASLAGDLPLTDEPLTLDLTELRFADAAVARLLIRTARVLPTGMRIAGCPSGVARLLTLLGGGWIPGTGLHHDG
ncbi:hypothetical protein Mco01_32030 [Microbispora corallina]|uniref:STAS domain-containing protein n=1 Tax=Microbispora corallina TaxID=83302 RepID=A0ABQ4FZP3_9ACTN|nr:MEDS domain-containing protein [Microbispora corallina]GIH40203.1 hypothetical protein Mco01_32030 [Microbispora corallina]